MKTYLIAIENNLPFDLKKFHTFLTTKLYPTYVSGWWHYLAGSVYIVETNLNVNQLSELIKPQMGGAHYIVIEVVPSNSQGWLLPEGWKWLGHP